MNPFAKEEVQNGPEMRRILEMPRRTYSPEEIEYITDRMTALLKTPQGTKRLFPIQALALYEMGTTGGLLGPIPVGGGKELICFLAARVMFATYPILIMPAHLVKRSQREMDEYGVHWRMPENLRITSYQMLGQANRSAALSAVPPDLFVLNECFTGDTLVETENGLARIDQIRAGDKVGAYDREKGFSWETVECAWSSEPKTMTEIVIAGMVVKATANHPFLTSKGWKRAEHLEIGDEIVRVVQRKTRVQAREAEVLRDFLFGEMAYVSARDSRKSTQLGNGQENFNNEYESRKGTPGISRGLEYSHEGEQPHAHARGSRASISESQRATSQATGGQGTSTDRAADGIDEAFARLDRRSLLEDSAGQATLLYDRYRAQGGEDCDRGGWILSQYDPEEGIGSQEGPLPEGTGLARVQSIQRRSPTKSERRARVYNLQVSGPSTYLLAGGLVVHNCHRIKNPNAAVTRRVVRHMANFPNAKFVAVSGTLLSKSIRDFAHIAKWCVKPCPLPEDTGTLIEWSEALDEKPGGWNQRDPGALLRLCNAEELTQSPEVAARLGFRRRLTETPGVIAATGGDDVAHANGDPIGLTIRALEYEQDPIVEKHYEKLRNEWATPSGWQFAVAMELWRHARTLALGMHLEWEPPPPGGPEGPWMLARKAWKKFVRATIKDSEHLDSELQVANACLKGALDTTAFNAWRAIEPSYTPRSRDVWHCTGAIEACLAWMKKGPGVVFTDHVFFAEELARRSGARYFGAQGLDKTGLEIEKADPESCVIASRVANSTGRNIQFWNRGLITAAPHNALEFEQLLGRFHRHGQTKDVSFDVMIGCIENHDGWTRAVELARATKDTLGAPQKLLIAQTEFPSAWEMSTRKGFKWQRVMEKS